MTEWIGYFVAENLALPTAQRTTLIAELERLGLDNNGDQPNRRNHWRIRLDNEAAIFEAAFDIDNLTVNKFKQRLATIFGVSVGSIDHSLTQPTFDTLPSFVVVFSRTGVDYLRVALFGGPLATWAQSRVEAATYIKANQAEWESDT